MTVAHFSHLSHSLLAFCLLCVRACVFSCPRPASNPTPKPAYYEWRGGCGARLCTATCAPVSRENEDGAPPRRGTRPSSPRRALPQNDFPGANMSGEESAGRGARWRMHAPHAPHGKGGRATAEVGGRPVLASQVTTNVFAALRPRLCRVIASLAPSV
ncbi:unnamed protein product [Chondrus crispus]|uniref:Secreted protein n=1 Tax=Chondrus crispus TaxID=2769 RepID=R7QMT8_CHOCR|nr:unnamed protein product [Chondrus crispus]CDF39827.1 unnamed protein product [Chondrus crispus]|eukprot:XP_005710121.1 unnamed protein product [Chondrus crispus]